MKNSSLISRVAIILIVLFAAFIFTAALVNLSIFDEDLRPEVSKLLQPPQISEPRENAYTAIWGINTAADKDIIDSGKRLVERYHSNREKQGLDGLTPQDFFKILGSTNETEEWLKSFNCSSRTQPDCVSAIRANLQSTAVDSQGAQLLSIRHQNILQMSEFVNWGNSTFAPTTSMPSYATMMNLSQYKLAGLFDDNSATAFLEQLALDMQFWRMVLDQGSDLIDKMVGIAGVWNDLQFLSEYMATYELQPGDVDLVMSILEPLSKNELNLEDAFKSEQRNLSRTLARGNQSLAAFGPLVSDWLIQTNATQNSYYQNVTGPIIELSRLSEKEFAAQTHTNDGSRKPQGRDAVDAMITIWPGTLYNLGGKVFLSKMLGYPADYIARVHDLNSMISLIKLQLYLKSTGVENTGQVLSTLSSHNIQLSEELAGKDVRFDSNEGWLQFDCLYKRSICRIRLK